MVHPDGGPQELKNIGSSLFSVGEVNKEVKIWNSRIACLTVDCLAAS
jgi:hypothetical protein